MSEEEMNADERESVVSGQWSVGNPRVVDYITLMSSSHMSLDNDVVVRLKQGWMLYGDPRVTASKTGIPRCYYQTMIKFAEEVTHE